MLPQLFRKGGIVNHRRVQHSLYRAEVSRSRRGFVKCRCKPLTYFLFNQYAGAHFLRQDFVGVDTVRARLSATVTNRRCCKLGVALLHDEF
jgi:hypothetical protein